MEMTIEKIKEEVLKMDKNIEPEGHSFQTAVILLSGLVVGPNAKKIAKFTGYPLNEVKLRADNLRSSGIWKGSKLAVDWFDEKDGAIAFWCDCLVADGLLERK